VTTGSFFISLPFFFYLALPFGKCVLIFSHVGSPMLDGPRLINQAAADYLLLFCRAQ
jgi:hypothetical protein